MKKLCYFTSHQEQEGARIAPHCLESKRALVKRKDTASLSLPQFHSPIGCDTVTNYKNDLFFNDNLKINNESATFREKLTYEVMSFIQIYIQHGKIMKS